MVEGEEMAKKNTAVSSEEYNSITPADIQPEEPKKVVEQPKPVESKKGKVINCERLNVRKGPSKEEEVVAVLKVGTVIVIEKIKDNKEWYKTPSGYVMSKFIKMI